MKQKGIRTIEDFAKLVALEIVAAQGTATDWYTQETAPVTRRMYLAAARRGDFPSFKKGRLVLAKKADVNGWIERTSRPAGARRSSRAQQLAEGDAAPLDPEVAEELEQLGFERKGAA